MTGRVVRVIAFISCLLFMGLLCAVSSHAQVGTILSAPGTCLRTFYIAAIGSDANNGTAKGTPWLHHPYMVGWTGTYAHAAGDCFIFKGGNAWNHLTLPLAIPASGTLANPDYYGVDQTWYSGGSFARPIFDCESNVGCGLIVWFQANVNYVTLDTLELRGVWAPANVDGRAVYASGGPPPSVNLILNNLNIHNWRMANGWTADSSSVAAIFFNTDVGSGDNTNVQNSLVHNEDGGYMNPGNVTIKNPGAGGIAISRAQNVTFNEIYSVSSVFLHGGMLVHDNYVHDTVSSWDPVFHTNNFYLDSWQTPTISSPEYFYRNKLVNVNSNAAPIYSNPCVQPSAGGDIKVYIYDNLVIGGTGDPPFGVDIDTAGNSGVSACGPPLVDVYIFNNTIQIPSSDTTGCGRTTPRPGTLINLIQYDNNHCIFDTVSGAWGFVATTVTNGGHNLAQTNATANGQGYTMASNYAPANTSRATVGAGVSISACVGCTDITKDISQAPRLLSGVWDIGAYEFRHRPEPPLLLTASPH